MIRSWFEPFNIFRVFSNLLKNREVIRMLTWRDFQAKFRGSSFGLVWAIFQPLLTIVIYTIVFSTFLKIKFGSSESPFIFAVYLLCGLIPWMAFSESILGSTVVIRGNANLVKRVIFPLEILPLNVNLVAMIQQVISLALLQILAWIVVGHIYFSIFLIPLFILIQFFFSAGLSWVWASLAVFFPDLRQITSLLLNLMMFLTPVFYPEEIVPRWALWLVRLNPLAYIIRMYRLAIMEGKFPSLVEVASGSVLGIAVFILGYYWFSRTKKMFVDVL